MIKKSNYILFVIIFLFGLFNISAQDNKYKEFDFWIGEWDVYKRGTDSIVGQSKIESIVDGKVIKETYHSTTSKYNGTSLNKYNPRTNQWEQFWVDNSGLTLHIKGNLENGIMILQNKVTNQKGVSVWNKIKWQKTQNNTVRQTWYQSTNKGQDWTTVFDGEYRKKKQ
ncbi:hypothetical protein [Aquimarina sp. 2201CG5-10]|uniref:hypothetical protein n=1 Tax=Aquimarina callyspongiae TaxID=3098150 RepID=UPI002AB5931D|nr:hypothetical protein [Aquimarina sp. 2201CG5-10]MDY8134060.1 hypothetical protein [Aquimarina sp. 2201CG5-10]